MEPWSSPPRRPPAFFAYGRRAGGTLLYALGTGIVALHVADDSFLQRQPGTSAADHLAGGLVPIALLALAAEAYPRVRPSFQAVLALTVGIFGVVVGATEALYHTIEVGPSGDDYAAVEYLKTRPDVEPGRDRRHRLLRRR